MSDLCTDNTYNHVYENFTCVKCGIEDPRHSCLRCQCSFFASVPIFTHRSTGPVAQCPGCGMFRMGTSYEMVINAWNRAVIEKHGKPLPKPESLVMKHGRELHEGIEKWMRGDNSQLERKPMSRMYTKQKKPFVIYDTFQIEALTHGRRFFEESREDRQMTNMRELINVNSAIIVGIGVRLLGTTAAERDLLWDSLYLSFILNNKAEIDHIPALRFAADEKNVAGMKLGEHAIILPCKMRWHVEVNADKALKRAVPVRVTLEGTRVTGITFTKGESMSKTQKIVTWFVNHHYKGLPLPENTKELIEAEFGKGKDADRAYRALQALKPAS